MTRPKRTTGDVDHSCRDCGVTPPSWGTLVVPVPGVAEYLCSECWAKRQTTRKAA